MTAVKKEQTWTEPVNSGLLNESQMLLLSRLSCPYTRTATKVSFWIKHRHKKENMLLWGLILCRSLKKKKKKGSESFFGLHKVIQCAAIPFFLFETTDTGYDCVRGLNWLIVELQSSAVDRCLHCDPVSYWIKQLESKDVRCGGHGIAWYKPLTCVLTMRKGKRTLSSDCGGQESLFPISVSETKAELARSFIHPTWLCETHTQMFRTVCDHRLFVTKIANPMSITALIKSLWLL